MASPSSSSVATSHWSDDWGRRAPNILTIGRMLAVPVFVVLLINPTPQSSLWATAIFVIASVTDWLDGYLARLYQAESILGKLLDPLADKVLVTAALVMLAAVPFDPRVPAWMVVVLLSRELIVTGLRSIAAIRQTVVPAAEWAKHKTAWTMIAIVFLLIHEPYHVGGMLIDFHFAGMFFLWIALVLSLLSGYAYAIQLREIWQATDGPATEDIRID
ncbi:MAG: CDP-diacylglycerol--glycerol-3-phosphate 3-phosphatidyltransferase [Bdellovibrionales bacterium]|nr:CDP-diacylglycerol--glycerol-3-phosphate 3-phosphatidyltransferase [Bdellovibrionales bacterium]